MMMSHCDAINRSSYFESTNAQGQHCQTMANVVAEVAVSSSIGLRICDVVVMQDPPLLA